MSPSEAEGSTFKPPSLPSPPTALSQSYTYHSPKPTTDGPYILGVDEAGRGPVLGPLVYGVAYCPVSYQEKLDGMGFADSKTLTHDTRANLLASLSLDPESLGWSVRVISPQAISSGMLRHPPINLNQQSQEATVLLIREVLGSGIKLSEVYVDALGPSIPYQAYLSSLFPTLSITVKPKADSIYTIVGAASVAAKVTRDAWIEGWIYEESRPCQTSDMVENAQCSAASENVAAVKGSDIPLGSGYPSDPKTQAWLKSALEPTFGFPSLVRFSWATVKIMLDKEGHEVQWADETQTSLIKAFQSGSSADKGRSPLAKELGIRSVSDL
ncbi:ribonuclease H-like domain-containing protein [Gautieria morchelliformis]|nr:ribonuclease H-like domain-containing protein [Gautieria morchelliformis]